MLKITYGGFDNKTAKKMSTQNWSCCGFYTFFWSFCVFSLKILSTKVNTLHPHLQEYRLLDNKGSKNEIFKIFSHPELDGTLRI